MLMLTSENDTLTRQGETYCKLSTQGFYNQYDFGDVIVVLWQSATVYSLLFFFHQTCI